MGRSTENAGIDIDAEVWANAPTFDNVLLFEAYDQAKLQRPRARQLHNSRYERQHERHRFLPGRRRVRDFRAACSATFCQKSVWSEHLSASSPLRESGFSPSIRRRQMNVPQRFSTTFSIMFRASEDRRITWQLLLRSAQVGGSRRAQQQTLTLTRPRPRAD
jgi:hypothetical protein